MRGLRGGYCRLVARSSDGIEPIKLATAHEEMPFLALASVQPTTPAAHDDVQPTPQRRKPGQKIKKGWRLTAAVELDGFIKEKGRRPSGPELAQRVDKKLKHYPDESDVRKLMRFLLDDE